MKKIAAIYIIVNNINHKIYVGSSSDFKIRHKGHFNKLKNGTHENSYLQNAWNKYSEENFVILPVEEFDKISEDLLRTKERWYISEFG